MKKILSILIITLFCITTFASPIAAEDSQVLFVSTESNDNFDDYVEENIHYFTQLYPYASEPVIGTGIKVYGSLNEQYIYPISVNGNIVATFTVTYKDNQFYCDYSENLANILDEYLCESNAGQPLCCYVNAQNEMCITSGERTYNLNNEQDVEYQEIQIECESHQFNPNYIEYEYHYQTSRSVVSYFHWTNYYIGTPEGLNCGPITLYNIYRNLPYYHTYTEYDTYRSHMNPLYYNYYGEGFNGTLTNYEVMKKYLIADEYSIGYQSESERMTESQISTTILNHHRYIMAFMKTGSGAGHIVGVVGETVNNTSVVYYIFDPHSGIHTTTEAGFSLLYCGDTYYWTGGYLGDFY